MTRLFLACAFVLIPTLAPADEGSTQTPSAIESLLRALTRGSEPSPIAEPVMRGGYFKMRVYRPDPAIDYKLRIDGPDIYDGAFDEQYPAPNAKRVRKLGPLDL